MGQQEVLEYLEKQKEPKSAGQITKDTGLSSRSVTRILNCLLNSKEIKYVEISALEAKQMFKCCRRMFMYYVE